MGLNYDKVIQSLLALKAPFRLNLPVFHYQAKCVAPLSSFYWWLVALSLRFWSFKEKGKRDLLCSHLVRVR